MAQTNYFVQMKVKNQTELKITTKSSATGGCPSIAKKGCIKAAKKAGEFEFTFLLAGKTTCTRDYVDASATWKLKAVYLGGFDGNKPGSFGFVAGADFDKVDNDFNVADMATGLLTLEANPRTDRIISITDKNEAKYDVWYKIVAECERNDGDSPYQITSDPRVRNGGN